ncbi:MAG: methyltransferase [Proteobacteria bacterium]|nr:methyltransferase [Pseudomonadota bacterium]
MSVEVQEIQAKCLQNGWTPGKQDVGPLVEAWTHLTDAEQDRALKALAKAGSAACLRLVQLWNGISPQVRGALARSLGRAVMNESIGSDRDFLGEWLASRVHEDSDERARKGFAQAIGSALQGGRPWKKESLILGLLTAGKSENINYPEAKALADALSKSGDVRAVEVVKRLGAVMILAQAKLKFRSSENGANPCLKDVSIDEMSKLERDAVHHTAKQVTRQQIILARDVARQREGQRASIDFFKMLLPQGSTPNEVVVRFIPGLEKLALKQSDFRSSFQSIETLGNGMVWGVLAHDMDSSRLAGSRLWQEIGVVMGQVGAHSNTADVAELLARCAEKLRRPMKGIQEGDPVRVRFGRENQLGRRGVWDFVEALQSLDCGLMCDGREAHWSIDLVSFTEGVQDRVQLVVATPQNFSDQRFSWRQDTVPGASQRTLAAALVIFAEVSQHSHRGKKLGPLRIWDPFCGAGTELVECYQQASCPVILTGTDIDAAALKIAAETAAKIGLNLNLLEQDALTSTGGFDIVITNPPFGMRTLRGEARGLLEAFFAKVRFRLAPRGCIVLLSHAPLSTIQWAKDGGLRLTNSLPVQLGGMMCEIQRFES